MLTVNEIDWVK